VLLVGRCSPLPPPVAGAGPVVLVVRAVLVVPALAGSVVVDFVAVTVTPRVVLVVGDATKPVPGTLALGDPALDVVDVTGMDDVVIMLLRSFCCLPRSLRAGVAGVTRGRVGTGPVVRGPSVAGTPGRRSFGAIEAAIWSRVVVVVAGSEVVLTWLLYRRPFVPAVVPVWRVALVICRPRLEPAGLRPPRRAVEVRVEARSRRNAIPSGCFLPRAVVDGVGAGRVRLAAVPAAAMAELLRGGVPEVLVAPTTE
jgi:hypothetical protein